MGGLIFFPCLQDEELEDGEVEENLSNEEKIRNGISERKQKSGGSDSATTDLLAMPMPPGVSLDMELDSIDSSPSPDAGSSSKRGASDGDSKRRIQDLPMPPGPPPKSRRRKFNEL